MALDRSEGARHARVIVHAAGNAVTIDVMKFFH